MDRFAKLISVLRDIAIIVAIIFICIAAYKFMVYFSVWNSTIYD